MRAKWALEFGYVLQEPESGESVASGRREDIGWVGFRNLAVAIHDFVIPNRTCRLLMYQVRLAAGLLRPDVQFKRSISLIRYFLLNPCIDGP